MATRPGFRTVRFLVVVQAVVAIPSLTLPVPAAQAAGWYIGGGIGAAEADDYKDPNDFSGSVDGDDTSVQFFGGFQFHEQLGVEVGYVDLGKLEFDGTFQGVSDRGTIETTGIKAALVGYLPFGNPWHVFGKLGAFNWELEEKETFGGTRLSDRESGTDPMYGIGVQFDVGDHLDMRVEWERYEDMGIGGTEGHVDDYSAKLLYRFY